MASNREVGQAGEDAAAQYLKRRKYKLLHRNLRLGRLGELDIVAMDGKTLVLVEVKSKLAGEMGGFDNITAAKQRKLRDLGLAYLQRHGGKHNAVRFDAIEVTFSSTGLKNPEIKHISDAFRG